MRIFHLSENIYEELSELPFDLPPQGFLWLGLPRREFELQLPTLQQRLQHWTGAQLLDLHASDLLNQQLPSHFDYTSWYDLMVFRRLAASPGALPGMGNEGTQARHRRQRKRRAPRRWPARPSNRSTPVPSALPCSTGC